MPAMFGPVSSSEKRVASSSASSAGMIAEASAMIDKAMLHRQLGPYQIQSAIAALHARARRPEETDWPGIERLYRALEVRAPSPVVTMNRAVAVWKLDGPQAALDLIAPLPRRWMAISISTAFAARF